MTPVDQCSCDDQIRCDAVGVSQLSASNPVGVCKRRHEKVSRRSVLGVYKPCDGTCINLTVSRIRDQWSTSMREELKSLIANDGEIRQWKLTFYMHLLNAHCRSPFVWY